MQKPLKMTETLASGYSSVSTQLMLSNEYQHAMVLRVFKNRCVFALEESSLSIDRVKLTLKMITTWHRYS